MVEPEAILRVLADGSAASVMQSYVAPVVQGMCVLASLICVFFLVNGGIHYMTSSGQPEKLASAKLVIRNALIGLIIVFAAGTLTAIFAHAYHQAGSSVSASLPNISGIQPGQNSAGLVGVLLKAITGVLGDIVQSVGVPFIKALSYFTSSTPLISANASVFNLWLAMVGMTDVIFVLVVALLGLHIMSYSTFGLEEIEFKHLLPQLGLVFLLINSSVFLIDGLIGLSNAMIHALHVAFGQTTVWSVLTDVVKQSGGFGLAALLIMVAFIIFSVILLIYYVGRIVTIYLGAVLSPLVLLVWLIPGFRDFALNAAKTYVFTVFVLFVHVVILELAASLFAGLIASSPTHTADPLMSMIIGLATLIALLKTQGVMSQLSYASIGPRTARKLGNQLSSGMSYFIGGRMAAFKGGSRVINTDQHHNFNSRGGQPTKTAGSSRASGSQTSRSKMTKTPSAQASPAADISKASGSLGAK
ncbi:MAG TPA: hypothetical protein VMR95_03070 [Candidatus Binatia bacterium]|nr:hypothetical protein [Candidatus Binatia bacterium]